MRNSIMDTYKELMAVRNDNRYPSSTPAVMPNPMVMEYTHKNGRREGLLYNNRILSGYRPSQQRKDEYNVNRDWILANFKK